jgi:hypothetical protein
MLELPFDELRPSELDEYLLEIDQKLDACFLGELEDAFAAALRAAKQPEPAPFAASA